MSYLEDEIRRSTNNTNTLIFLKTCMEINFMKFIIYRKLDRLFRLNHSDDSSDKLQTEICDCLCSLSEWVGMLKSVQEVKPRDDFFDDISELGKDLQRCNDAVREAFNDLDKIVQEYKLIVENIE